MTKRKVKITNSLGLHARPAALFVQTASKFDSQIYLEKDGFRVDGKSILEVLMLAAECGSELVIMAEGPDEDQAIERLVTLIESKFEEE